MFWAKWDKCINTIDRVPMAVIWNRTAPHRQPPVIGVVNSTIIILPDHFDRGWSVEDAANLVERRDLNVRSWHEADVQRLPGLGPLTGA
jgi:hypothetical protein